MDHEIVLDPNANTVDLDRFVFDQCAMTVRSGLLPDGDYVLNGQYESVSIWHVPSDAGVERSYHQNYDAFSLKGASGLEYHVQARVRNAGGYYWPYTRTTTITDYRKLLPGGQLAESVADTQYEYTRGYYLDRRNRTAYTLNVSGTVSSEQTANQNVTINTNSTLNYKWGASNEELTPFNGSMEMLAEDGSFLSLSANPDLIRDDRNNSVYRLDLAYTNKNGEQELKSGVEIHRYRWEGSRCVNNRRPSCAN